MQNQGNKASVQNLHKFEKYDSNQDGKLSERFMQANSNERKWAHSLTENYGGE